MFEMWTESLHLLVHSTNAHHSLGLARQKVWRLHQAGRPHGWHPQCWGHHLLPPKTCEHNFREPGSPVTNVDTSRSVFTSVSDSHSPAALLWWMPVVTLTEITVHILNPSPEFPLLSLALSECLGVQWSSASSLNAIHLWYLCQASIWNYPHSSKCMSENAM